MSGRCPDIGLPGSCMMGIGAGFLVGNERARGGTWPPRAFPSSADPSFRAAPDGAARDRAQYAVNSRRLGEPVPAEVTLPRVAFAISALATPAGVAPGLLCRYSAATPATCGEA